MKKAAEVRFNKYLGIVVKEAREKSDLTMAGLGEKIGVSKITIYNIEMGKQAIRFHHLIGLSRELNIDINSLVKVYDVAKKRQKVSDVYNMVASFTNS